MRPKNGAAKPRALHAEACPEQDRQREIRYLATRIAMEMGVITPRMQKARTKAQRIAATAPCVWPMHNLGKPSKQYAALCTHMQQRGEAAHSAYASNTSTQEQQP